MGVQVSAPQRRPRSGGIKDIIGPFVIEPRLSVSLAGGGINWEDSACGPYLEPTQAGCYDLVVAAEEKSGESVNQFGAIQDPFAGYAGVQCYLGGDLDGPSFEEQAVMRLELAEDRYVEGYLWEWASGSTVYSAPDLVQAIAKVEEYADNFYTGQPVILMSRATAVNAFAAGALEREAGRLVTANGSPVLASGSVPTLQENMVAAIGWPEVYASPILSRRAAEHRSNIDLAIAERVYAIGVDCDFSYLVEVTTP